MTATGMLALVGGGEWSPGCTFDQVLIDASGATEVAVLPTGSAYENPGRLIEQARAWFADLGVGVLEVPVLTRRDAAVAEHADALRSARMIYLAGTSAMHVRAVLKDTPVFEALLEAWVGGAALAGTNAGADVLCDPMVDSRGGAFTVGLGVVSQMSIIPRVEQWSRDKVHRTVELAPSGLSLVGIPSATALLRDPDGRWRAEGASVAEVSVFIDGRPATPADLVA
ncbi:MAG: Type 1 glutamine amidotransferase-like domain-containing protein [Acidimicrobiales bacterium]